MRIFRRAKKQSDIDALPPDEAAAARAVISHAAVHAGDMSELMKVVGAEIEELEQKRQVGALVAILSSTPTSWAVRTWAAKALGRLQDRRALSPLLDATRDSHWGPVCAAAEALGEIGDPAATPRLEELLEWIPPAASVGAVREFVGTYGNAPRMSGAFEAAAASAVGQAEADDVRKAAREALEKIRAEKEDPPSAQGPSGQVTLQVEVEPVPSEEAAMGITGLVGIDPEIISEAILYELARGLERGPEPLRLLVCVKRSGRSSDRDEPEFGVIVAGKDPESGKSYADRVHLTGRHGFTWGPGKEKEHLSDFAFIDYANAKTITDDGWVVDDAKGAMPLP